MGEVYRAHDERLDRDVAIKVLHEAVAQDRDRLARFEREAKAVAKLDHPNILAIHDFGTDKGITYAVMELLKGVSLREVISRVGLTTAKAVAYARSIADGLAAAHHSCLVHRDLKPENVFLTRDGRIKILDFGLAKLKVPEADLTTETPTETLDTVPGGLLGTVPYMAPEQIQGQSADHRSDIFALGVVLYEMLTGSRPFGGTTSVETAAAILKEDPDSISVVAPGVSPTLASVVSKCLEKRPEDRFSSAHDLSLTLGAIDSKASVAQISAGSVLQRRWPHVLAVAIAVVVGLLVILPPEALVDRLTGTTDTLPIRSIALLPLENLTGDPEQAYFVDGLHGELIATFAQITAFDKVIGRRSVMGFRDSDTPIREIGRQLDVDAVLEGSVRRSGDKVRATLQLIDARTEENLWADGFDRNLTDILALQSDVARAVANEVRLALTPEERRRLEATGTVNDEAYEAYLKGVQYLLNSGLTQESLTKAIVSFETSIEKDPTYAPAHLGLSRALQRLTVKYRPPTEVMPRARAAVLKALELDASSAEAHCELGRIKASWEWDWIGAEYELLRAIELGPNSVVVLTTYAGFLVSTGRVEEAVSLERRVVQLDPASTRPLTHPGWLFWYARRYDDGIESLLDTIELHPNNPTAHLYLSWNYWAKGMYTEALAALERTGKLRTSPQDNPYYIASLAFAQGFAGRSDEAAANLQLLLELRNRTYVPPWLVAIAYTGFGDTNRAIEWLERGYEARDAHLMFIKTNPAVDSLRDDPRLQDILRRMNFPEN